MNSNSGQAKFGYDAFTIVELLVVIVVIGILAAITIVSYSGISNKATVAAIQSDLSNIREQIELYKVDNSDGIPSSISKGCVSSGDILCVKTSGSGQISSVINSSLKSIVSASRITTKAISLPNQAPLQKAAALNLMMARMAQATRSKVIMRAS